MNKFNFNSYDSSMQSISYCEVDKCKAVKKLKQTLAEIKKLVEKEFCRHPKCCEFCAISNDCINQKIIEKINEVEDES